MDAYGDRIGEWQGVPVPVPELRMQLCKDHPLAGKMAQAERILYPPEPASRACRDDEGRYALVNQWFSYSRQHTVYLLRDQATAQPGHVPVPQAAADRGPDPPQHQPADRLDAVPGGAVPAPGRLLPGHLGRVHDADR